MNNQRDVLKCILSVAILMPLVMASLYVNAQTFTVLHTFTNTPDGANPYSGGGMVLSDNTLFGTACQGGSSGHGVVFSVHTDGTDFGILYNFTGGSDGSIPAAGLVLSGNNLYGTTLLGGTNGSGAVFAVTTNGSNFTVLHSFAATTPSITSVQPNTIVTNIDGACPYGELLLLDNRLYGTTSLGGSNASGTAFSLNTDGTDFNVLHSFAVNGYAANGNFGVGTNSDGFYSTAGLVSLGGMLYGTTSVGGTNQNGVVFAMSTNGSNFTVLHTFAASTFPAVRNLEGRWPYGLVLSSNILYGATSSGGSKLNGTVFSLYTNGTAFTLLHNFTSSEGNGGANLSVVGNKLYGPRTQSGPNGSGMVFSLNTDATGFKILYSFSAKGNNGTNTDGAYTTSSLVLAGNTLYGAPQQGGSQGFGTVFALQLPLIISGIVANPDDSVTLDFMGTPYLTYLVQATTNLLSQSSWQTIATNVAGVNGSWQCIDTNANNYPSRFYRSTIP